VKVQICWRCGSSKCPGAKESPGECREAALAKLTARFVDEIEAIGAPTHALARILAEVTLRLDALERRGVPPPEAKP
jgi:hypothetical protein